MGTKRMKRKRKISQTLDRPSSARPCSATSTAAKDVDHPPKAVVQRVYVRVNRERSVGDAFKRQSSCRTEPIVQQTSTKLPVTTAILLVLLRGAKKRIRK